MRKSHTCFQNGYHRQQAHFKNGGQKYEKTEFKKKYCDKIPRLISSTTVVTLQTPAVSGTRTAKGPGGKVRAEF